MAGISDRTNETSREEDYRDYEERDLTEGWPYPDSENSKRKRNEAYGTAPAGLDGDTNPGAEIASGPAIRSEGGPALSQAIAQEAIDDDALEEAIYDRFTASDDVDEDQITITVRNGVAELSGNVETAAAASAIARIAATVAGVKSVRNALVPIGIDSGIPDDASD